MSVRRGASQLAVALALSWPLAACGATAPAAPSASSGTSAKPAAAGSDAASASGAPIADAAKVSAAYSVASPGFWPLYLAADTGIFQKNGLDVALQLIPGAPTAAAAMISGQIQFAQFGGGAAMSSAANGSDLMIVTVMIPVYQFVLYVAPDIKSATDLKGKKVGVVALGGSEDHISMRAGLGHLGLDPDKDVAILAVGDRVTALLNGAIQGAVLTPPDTLNVEAKGFRPLLDLASTKLPHLGQSSVSTRAYVSAHRDVAQKYVDSLIQGIAKLKQDRALSIEVLGKRIKSDDQHAMGVAYDFYTHEIFPALPEPKPELFQDAITELGKEDAKIRTFDVNSIVDASFVRSAASRGLDKS